MSRGHAVCSVNCRYGRFSKLGPLPSLDQTGAVGVTGGMDVTGSIPTPPAPERKGSSYSRDRILTLADGVFAIAITLLAFNIVPHIATTVTGSQPSECVVGHGAAARGVLPQLPRHWSILGFAPTLLSLHLPGRLTRLLEQPASLTLDHADSRHSGRSWDRTGRSQLRSSCTHSIWC